MTTICRRSGVTGSSTPTIARERRRPGAGRADHRAVATRPPRLVRTARISLPTASIPSDLAPGDQRRAEPPGGGGIAEYDGLRRTVPVAGEKQAATRPSGATIGASRIASATSSIRVGCPAAFCSRVLSLEQRDAVRPSTAGTGSRPGAGRSPARGVRRTGRTPPGCGRRARCSARRRSSPGRRPPPSRSSPSRARSAPAAGRRCTPASARWKAMLVPITPPPTITTSAALGQAAHGSRKSRSASTVTVSICAFCSLPE